MKILQLPAYFYPESAASSHLSSNLREAYAENGFDMELFCPVPTRGVTDDERAIYKKLKYEELLDGHLKVHRFNLMKEGKNPIGRALRYFLCNIKHYSCAVKCKDADIIAVSSTPPTQGVMAALVKKRLKVPFIYDLQDIFPDSLVNTGLTKKGSLIWKIGRKIENFTYKNADKITVISEDFKRNIMEKGVPEEKIEVVYNWVDENAVVSVEREKNPLFDKYELDRDKFYICYSGNIGHTQNMDMLCSVAKQLEDNSKIGFVIVGDGAYKQKLVDIIEEKQIKNITLIPFQDYSDISYVFSLGDMGLIISKKGVGSNSVPSKTWSVMSASRPVLASFDKDSEINRIITENECGVCVEADDEKALIDAIVIASENTEVIKQMGLNGREFILNNLTREIGTNKKVNIIKQVVENHNAKR